MKAQSVVIYKKHRSNGNDRWLKDKKLYKDEKGLYIIYDRSTWYVQLHKAGFYESIAYRSYLG